MRGSSLDRPVVAPAPLERRVRAVAVVGGRPRGDRALRRGGRGRRAAAVAVGRASTRSTGAEPRRRCGRSTPRTAAASTRCPSRGRDDLEAAESAFARRRPGRRRADPSRRSRALDRPGRRRARRASCAWPIPIVGPTRSIPRTIDGAAWAALVFGASETAVALLTSTPGRADVNVLTNRQIAAARDVVERYAGTGRVLTHTIVHPNLGPSRARRDGRLERDAAARRAGSATRCGVRRRRRRRPAVGSSTTKRSASRSSNACARSARGSSRRTRASAARFPTRRSRPRRRATSARPRRRSPTSRSSCTTPATSAIRTGRRAPYDPDATHRPRLQGVDRLVRSLADAGIGPDGNVYAELGTTWFLMLRRPRGGRARARASCSSRSARSASCGAPIVRGTDRRSR